MTEWLMTLFSEHYISMDKKGKTVEGRAPNPERPEKNYLNIKFRDKIIFRAIDHEFNPMGWDDIIYPVCYNHHYFIEGNVEGTIEQMIIGEGLHRLLPDCSSVDQGIKIYKEIPGYAEKISQYGICAIGLGLKY